jgi:glycosyltransferase involved in cell wall biosynthesis
MRVLTFGTLYPDSSRPQHGIFVEHRLRRLVATGGVEARVIAPVPWFPLQQRVFGEWGAYARVPAAEVRHGIEVRHPRFLTILGVGMNLAPALLARGARPALQALRATGFDFDVIDAQYFYPDGVAAIELGRHFDRPVVITARGSDLNVIARYPVPRRLIAAAAHRADGLVTVCDALRDVLVDLGVAAERVTVLRNGVDLQLFRPPTERARLRERLGLQRTTLLSVGNLVPMKGHELVIAALRDLPECDLAIAGAGPSETSLRALARASGLADRVRFLGRVAQDGLSDWYGAADMLVLASASEGLANVLLEAMACGTPVAATAVGGTPEVVSTPAAGVLIAERSAAGVAVAVRTLLQRRVDRLATRRYAEGFSWDATAGGLKALLDGVVAARAAAH